MGKKTTLTNNSDIDIVLFINEEQPLFKDVLDEFEDILDMTDSYNIHNIHKSKHSVQFKAGEFVFDLLPAANFQPENPNDEVQQKIVLDRIKRGPPEAVYMYSSSLAPITVKFMERQDGFVNEMVRLAKYWYKSLYLENYISGAKMLIELVAVFVANKEIRTYNERSHLRCFSDIIRMLQSFDGLNIVFMDEYKMPEHQPPVKTSPRVLDPANPYNNLAENWKYADQNLLKGYAAETYRRLCSESNSSPMRMDIVFEPQPSMRHYVVEMLKNYHFLLEPAVTHVTDVKLEIRKASINRTGVELLKYYLDYAWVACLASPNKVPLMPALQKAINKHIGNFKWESSIGRHEDYDGTFTFPSDAGSVSISFREK